MAENQKLDPGSAAQHFALRSIRGTRLATCGSTANAKSPDIALLIRAALAETKSGLSAAL